MGTTVPNEENIIEKFACFYLRWSRRQEPDSDLYTGSGSDQKVPATTGSGSAKLFVTDGSKIFLLHSRVLWIQFKFSEWSPLVNRKLFASNLSYIYLSWSGSVFGIRIRIHKVPEYGSNLELDPQHWYVIIQIGGTGLRDVQYVTDPVTDQG